MMLLTSAFGLASVFVFDSSLRISDEIFVELPQVESESLIIISPTDENCNNYVLKGRSEWCSPIEQRKHPKAGKIR